MQYSSPLIQATLIKRYKRFLADIRFQSGEVLTIHCPNPGAMTGLDEPGATIWVSDSNNPKRKLRYTFELYQSDATHGQKVGINTMIANKLAREAMESGHLPQLGTITAIRPEVKYGSNSRVDFVVENVTGQSIFVEVKNVHLQRTPYLHEFPDCKTARGKKHLEELTKIVESGSRAMMYFVVQRDDGDKFTLARDIDPEYAQTFDKAVNAGVEVCVMTFVPSPTQIVIGRTIEFTN